MRKLFSFIAAVLFAGSMMAQVTITPDNCGWTATAGAQSGVVEGVTVANTNGLAGVDASTGVAAMRIYKNATLTISAESNIVKIEFTCVENGTTKFGPGCFEAQEGYTFEAEGPKGTWVGSAKQVAFVASGNQVRATQIVVTLEGGDEPAEPVVVYNWAKEEADQVGTTVLGNGGKTTISTVKIHSNADEVPAIKFEKGYKVAEGHYMAIYPAEGAFKAGDSIVFEAVINNSGARTEKYAMVDFYAADQTTRLFRGDTVVNGQTMADDPIVEGFKLAADQDSILIGRYGTTNMFILALKVIRSEAQEEKLTFDFKLENNILTITPSNDDPWAGWALPTAVITEEFGGSIEALVEVAKDMMEPTQGKVNLDITTLDPEDFPAGTECTFVVWGLVEGAVTTIDSYEFVIPEPAQPITCAEVVGLEKDTEVTMKDVTVTYVNGKNVWIKDETGALLLYLPANATWKQGDVLSNLAGKVAIYNNKIYEVIPSADQVAAVVVTEGEAPLPEKLFSVTEADLSKYALVNVTFEADAAFAQGTASNITIKVGEQEIVLRNNFKNGYEFGANKEYDITVLVTYYQGALQLYFVSAVQVGGEPTMDYYVVGTMTDWKANADYKLAANLAAQGEFMGEFAFKANDGFKVAYSDGATIADDAWFPDGMENEYKITEDGDYAVYFRPDGQGGEGWHYGYIYVAKKEAPVVDTITCAKAAEDALAGQTYETYVKGYVTEIAYEWKNGSMSFWMADEKDGGKVFEAYKCAIEKEEDAVRVGDLVKAHGELTQYNGTPELKAGCTVEILERAPEVVPQNLGEKTIAEFLELKNRVDTCILTGTVKNIVMDSQDPTKPNIYGNFDLEDATASVYVYGLLTPEGEAKKFQEMGIVEGDVIIIKALYNEYNNNPQVKNAILVRKIGQGLDNTDAEVKVEKFFRDGQLIIRKNGVEYNAQGAIVR